MIQRERSGRSLLNGISTLSSLKKTPSFLSLAGGKQRGNLQRLLAWLFVLQKNKALLLPRRSNAIPIITREENGCPGSRLLPRRLFGVLLEETGWR